MTPSIVGILGFITLFSADGFLGGILPIYGLGGIVLAHAFFYAPFMATFLWQAWLNIPSEQFKLSRQLGLSTFDRFKYVEYPALKPYLLAGTWLVFCMSLASFTTVLILGGGPNSTTLPVALYQSLFSTLNFPQAMLFAILQVGLCILAYSVMLLLPEVKPQPTQHIDSTSLSSRLGSFLSLGLTLLLLLPLILVIFESLSYLPNLSSSENLLSLQKSLLIALFVGPTSTFIALGALVWSKSPRLISLLGSVFLIAPLSLFGFGAFWIQLHLEWVPDMLIIIILNVLLTLPFALHFLKAPVLQITSTYTNLSKALGLSKLTWMHLVLFPLLRKPFAQSLGFCSALAAGDLTALLMISDYDNPGLSALLFQQMGGYRGGEALATALLLMMLCWGLMTLFHTLLRGSPNVKFATN